MMQSDRDYRTIRGRFKSYHDVEIQKNSNRALTQQEERMLLKFTQESADGRIKFIPGFEATATRLKIPVISAKKRCA